MTRRPLSLAARITVALVAVALLAVGLSMAFADRGLSSRLDQFAHERLDAAAQHSAALAASLYRENGGWTADTRHELGHLAEMNGYRLTLSTGAAAPPQAGHFSSSAPVIVGGKRVGGVAIAPVRGGLLTGEDRRLKDRLNELHLLAAAGALLAAIALGMLLARAISNPLTRLTETAQEMERGKLDARVSPGGPREVEQLGRALNRLSETLEHEEAMRRGVAADVAHELRTPLAGIVSRIEGAQDGVVADDAQNLEAMHAEALRLSQLVDDLGKLAEAETPGLVLTKVPLDLADIARHRVDAQADFFQGKGLVLERRLEPAPLLGDERRIEQIIDNLLSNALRYTDGGGRVSVDVHRAGTEVVLEVADTGIGIPPEDLPYLFERFWRGERSRARRTGGAGIGLAIVRELVKAHDGRIDVESKPGEGSLFRVTLPAVAER